MFKVDVKGFRQLMLGRPRWHFIRELISNSLDELSVGYIIVTLDKTPRYCNIKVEDDGDGFERLSDAYTLFAPTKKRSDAKVRGRFNLGEKELASISKEMSIETTTGKVVFKDDKLFRHPKTKRENGTVVSAIIPMNNEEYEFTKNILNWIIIPMGKQVEFRIDGRSEVFCGFRDQVGTSEETLSTVLYDFESDSFRPTKRKTTVNIYLLFANQDSGWLFELGIPVQQIDCGYNVDIQQKIPMNVNRDAVLDSYLQDIYAIVLNEVHDELDEDNVSESWVITASQDERTSDDAFTSVRDKKYGEKSVFWSSDLQANEDAMSSGYSIIHGRTMSSVERKRMKGVGLVSASENFTRPTVSGIPVKRNDWSESMKQYELITHKLCKILGIRKAEVRYVKSQASTIAQYNNHTITNNVSNFQGGVDFNPMNPQYLGVILHELAHMKSGTEYCHDSNWYNQLENFGGTVLERLLNV